MKCNSPLRFQGKINNYGTSSTRISFIAYQGSRIFHHGWSFGMDSWWSFIPATNNREFARGGRYLLARFFWR
jgi:hypothetical protein